MKENKTAHLKRKQGYEIKKLRTNVKLRLLAFLRFSSSYVLGLSDYRDTALHRFCSLGPLPSTSGTRFCTVREKS